MTIFLRTAATLTIGTALLSGCGSGVTVVDAPPAATVSASIDGDMAGIETRYGVRVGVTAIDVTTGATLTHRADELFAMCSTFKTYAVGALLRLDPPVLDDRVRVEPADVVENSPVTEAAVGTELSYAALAEAALTRSDNTAGNLLLRRIGGPAAITGFARSVGDDRTRLDRWEPELNSAERGDERDTTTADALARGYRQLLLDNALPTAERDRLTAWLRASVTSGQRMRAGLPPGWSAADKTGAGSFGTVNDAGVVWRPDGRPIVLVVLTDSTGTDPKAAANNQVIADVTARVIAALPH